MQFWRESKAVAARVVNEWAGQQIGELISQQQDMPGVQHSRVMVVVSDVPERGVFGLPWCRGSRQAMRVQLEEGEWVAPLKDMFKRGCYMV